MSESTQGFNHGALGAVVAEGYSEVREGESGTVRCGTASHRRRGVHRQWRLLPLAVDASRERPHGPPAARHAAGPGFPPRKPGPRAIGSPWSRGPLRNVEHWQSGLVGSLGTSRFGRRKGSSSANTRFSLVVATLGLPTLHFPQHLSSGALQNRSRAAKRRRPRGRVAAKSRCEYLSVGGKSALIRLTRRFSR